MNFPERKTRQGLIDYLGQQGNRVNPGKISSLLGLETTPNPWYIQGILGFSAWISAFFLLFFIFIFFRQSSFLTMIIAGISFAGIAISSYRSNPDNIFVTQLAVIFSIVGLILFEVALISNFRAEYGIRMFAVTAILFEIIVFLLHAENIRRYIAINNILISFLILIHTRDTLLSFQIAYAILALLTLFTWETYSKFPLIKGQWLRILCFALPMLLLLLLLFTQYRDIVYYRFWKSGQQNWWPATLAIGLVFIVLIIRIYNRQTLLERESPNKFPILFSITLVILIAALTHHSPGIIGALFVLVLAYAHGNRILMAFSLSFLAVFIGFYYYNMKLSLLDKSISLMAIGLTLLLAAWIFQQFTGTKGNIK